MEINTSFFIGLPDKKNNIFYRLRKFDYYRGIKYLFSFVFFKEIFDTTKVFSRVKTLLSLFGVIIVYIVTFSFAFFWFIFLIHTLFEILIDVAGKGSISNPYVGEFNILSTKHLFGYFQGIYLFILLFTAFSAHFRLFDKFIIFLLFIYFKIYFTVLDYFPHRFSLEDQERDFYLDIHKSGNTLISDLTTLETLINEFKEGTINPKMGTYLNKVLNQTTKLHDLIEDRGYFLKGKEQFQNFLHQLFNEILEKYANSYSLLEERIKKIEEGIEFSNLNEEEKNTLKNYISPILEKNKAQLSNLRSTLLEKRMIK